MSFWFEWLGKIVVLLFIILVADALLPHGGTKRYVKFTVSLFILLIFLEPVLRITSIQPEDLLDRARWVADGEVVKETGERMELQKQELIDGQTAYTLEQTEETLYDKLEPVFAEEGLELNDVTIDREEEKVIVRVDEKDDSSDAGKWRRLAASVIGVEESAILMELEGGG